MKTFVFATDFSENACDALAYAVPFIKILKGRILLFHAFEHANPYVEVPPYVIEKLDKENQEDALTQLAVWQRLVHEIDPELECDYIARKGRLIQTLKTLVDEKNIDGVFMGTKGASGIKKVIIGSNAADVITKLPCPVMAIPEGYAFQGINKIVYAVDFRSDYGFVLKELKELVVRFDAEIEILHVATENTKVDLDIYDWYQESVKTLFLYQRISFKTVKQNSVQAGIDNYIKEYQPDLVVMATMKKNWLDRMVKGSTTRQQVFHTQKPLLIFHGKVAEPIVSQYSGK